LHSRKWLPLFGHGPTQCPNMMALLGQKHRNAATHIARTND
jgi:hypothetical protein